MILYGLFSLFLILLGIILTPLASLPGISSVESAIQPYINALIQLIQ